MSGVTCLLQTGEAALEAGHLNAMTAAMAFRGPDGVRTWSDGKVGMGHALLRTGFGSDADSQPSTVDGEMWISADARLDGRAALARRLRLSPDIADAELILHAYRAWGDACLDYLRGDFAFVLWDVARQRLLAARDQLGVGQLFTTRVNGTLLLGNTIQSLLAHPGVDDALDEQTLADMALLNLSVDDAATGYAAIRRLPPGHKLTWDPRGVRVERYWTLGRPDCVRYRRSEEYAEHFRELFDQAVGDRLRTDCAGSQLSGGMDSTSVAVTAQHLLRAGGRPFDLRAYAIDHRALIDDEEGTLAEQVAQHAGIPIEVLSGEDYLAGPPESDAEPTWVPPEPGFVTLWGMADLCRRTASFARVLLTGYGGDPLFSPPEWSWRGSAAALRSGNWRWPAGRVRTGIERRRRERQPGPLPAWVNPDWAQRVDLAERQAEFHRRSRIDQVGMIEAPLWRTLFALADPGYSGIPLDIRFPFFDLRLIEFALAVNPVPWLVNKRVLRDAMRDRLPGVVLTRPKTPMAGDVALEHNRQSGIPPWQIDLIASGEMAKYVDFGWVRDLRTKPQVEQAQAWANERPPVQLAYWFRHRPQWYKRSVVRTGEHRAAQGGSGRHGGRPDFESR